MSKTELKPCPFCGGEFLEVGQDCIICCECATIKQFTKITEWNERPLEEKLKEELEEVKAFCQEVTELSGVLDYIRPDDPVSPQDIEEAFRLKYEEEDALHHDHVKIAIRKQVPWAPKAAVDATGQVRYYCGNCEGKLDDVTNITLSWDYCGLCGQRVLWEKKYDR